MKIRKARISDLGELIELEEKITAMHGQLDSFYEEAKNSEKETKKFLKEQIKSKDSCIFVAEDESRIIGYIIPNIARMSKIFKVKEFGRIFSIFVLEKYRNKRIAKALFEESYKWFKTRKIKWVELSVHIKNKGGIKFWEKSGFKTTNFKMRKLL